MNFYNLHIINDFNIKKYELLSLNEIKNKKNFILIKKKICIINEKQSLRTINTLINFFNYFNIKFTIINNKHNFKKENIKDFSKTLGILYDYLFFRSYNDIIVKLIAKFSGSIIINMLSNGYHPFQSINDIFLLNNYYIYFFGDFNSNVFKSIIINLVKINKFTIIIFSPKKFWNYIFLKKIFSKKKIIITEKIIFINKKIIIYNDVWFSMGETNFKKKINNLINFQINKKIFNILKIKKIFHCLPSYKKKKLKINSEIEECIFESNFIFFDKQIIEKVYFFKSYFFISNKTFFNFLI
ncbi:ornithine carbamoyltransferase [Candidatus Carsonella ruddii]|uniref:ornithine carbamoyltransferase n=1 Tax=Candidatus Carsonella ruddii HC isolate Thao2000 TaxID=1202538 RepID=J3VPQ3_CARRU|nr:ornithine carbamoyltransferase [Candidatus Carsonella ruddii]AFP83866.1 ornithine carbamoyltransferase [Candidatus Carsonella ruddii HC isolate Thao2000]